MTKEQKENFLKRLEEHQFPRITRNACDLIGGSEYDLIRAYIFQGKVCRWINTQLVTNAEEVNPIVANFEDWEVVADSIKKESSTSLYLKYSNRPIESFIEVLYKKYKSL